jgi:hypothetical protein
VCPAPCKRPVRLRATYHRTHGIRYFHGCYSVGDDQLWGVTWHRKGADHTLAAQRRERARVRSERQQRWGRPRPKAA